jgi:hypothetical protein
MLPSSSFLPMRFRLVSFASILLALTACAQPARAQSAYVRVSQVGYESGETPFRAYLMSRAEEPAATFDVVNSKGALVYSGHVGALLGTWSHSPKVTYNVYALDFTAPGGDLYTVSVPGSSGATSPPFAVEGPE